MSNATKSRSKILAFFMEFPFLHDFYNPNKVKQVEVKRWDERLLDWRPYWFDDEMLLLDSDFKLASVIENHKVVWFRPCTWKTRTSQTLLEHAILSEVSKQVTLILSWNAYEKALTVHKPPKGFSNLHDWTASVLDSNKVKVREEMH